MLTRLVLSVFFLIGMQAAGPVAAQDYSKASAKDRKEITQCVRNAFEQNDGASSDKCMFIVAEPCQERPGGSSTVGMRSCMQRETVIWDELLNRNYKRLQKNVSRSGAEKLKQMQRQWIKWRDKKCEMPYILFEGGTMAGPLAAGCILRATAIRAIELREAVEAVGG